MDEEIEAIQKYQTWQLVNLPQGNDAIGVKWIYKTKHQRNFEVQNGPPKENNKIIVKIIK